MKILNLYAGIGGNRMLWGNKHQITAIEFNKSVADAYKHFYPNDTVIVADAHQYLLDHYHEFGFIWASPPCQTHSRLRKLAAQNYHYTKSSRNLTLPVYPDMKLWQEIIFLQHHCRSNWVVENVIPYYKPLINPSFSMARHLFWSNKVIFDADFQSTKINFNNNGKGEKRFIDISDYKFTGIRKLQVLRNMVDPELGLYVFEQITGEKV